VGFALDGRAGLASRTCGRGEERLAGPPAGFGPLG
jgi:hypothetical protein